MRIKMKLTKVLFKIAFTFFLIPSLFGQATLQGDVWQLNQLVDAKGVSHQIKNSQNYTIEFKSGGQAAIMADCNGCGASYSSVKSNIEIKNGFCTEIYCGDESLDSEFLSALASVNTWESSENTLLLKDGSDNILLTFSNGNPIDPAGNPPKGFYDDWTLESIQLGTGKNPEVQSKYNLNFSQDGGVNYRLDCNSCNSKYTATDLTFNLGLGACTMMGCVVDPVETNLGMALTGDVNYKLRGNQLFILYHEGVDTLIYTNGETTGLNEFSLNNPGPEQAWKVEYAQGNVMVHFEKPVKSGVLSIYQINGKRQSYLSNLNTATVSFGQSFLPGSYLLELVTPTGVQHQLIQVH